MSQVMLEGIGEIVAVTKIEVGAQIYRLEHFQISLFVCVLLLHGLVGNGDHAGVLNLVNGVMSNQPDLSSLGDKDDVESLEKPDES